LAKDENNLLARGKLSKRVNAPIGEGEEVRSRKVS